MVTCASDPLLVQALMEKVRPGPEVVQQQSEHCRRQWLAEKEVRKHHSDAEWAAIHLLKTQGDTPENRQIAEKLLAEHESLPSRRSWPRYSVPIVEGKLQNFVLYETETAPGPDKKTEKEMCEVVRSKDYHTYFESAAPATLELLKVNTVEDVSKLTPKQIIDAVVEILAQTTGDSGHRLYFSKQMFDWMDPSKVHPPLSVPQPTLQKQLHLNNNAVDPHQQRGFGGSGSGPDGVLPQRRDNLADHDGFGGGGLDGVPSAPQRDDNRADPAGSGCGADLGGAPPEREQFPPQQRDYQQPDNGGPQLHGATAAGGPAFALETNHANGTADEPPVMETPRGRLPTRHPATSASDDSSTCRKFQAATPETQRKMFCQERSAVKNLEDYKKIAVNQSAQGVEDAKTRVNLTSALDKSATTIKEQHEHIVDLTDIIKKKDTKIDQLGEKADKAKDRVIDMLVEVGNKKEQLVKATTELKSLKRQLADLTGILEETTVQNKHLRNLRDQVEHAETEKTQAQEALNETKVVADLAKRTDKLFASRLELERQSKEAAEKAQKENGEYKPQFIDNLRQLRPVDVLEEVLKDSLPEDAAARAKAAVEAEATMQRIEESMNEAGHNDPTMVAIDNFEDAKGSDAKYVLKLFGPSVCGYVRLRNGHPVFVTLTDSDDRDNVTDDTIDYFEKTMCRDIGFEQTTNIEVKLCENGCTKDYTFTIAARKAEHLVEPTGILTTMFDESDLCSEVSVEGNISEGYSNCPLKPSVLYKIFSRPRTSSFTLTLVKQMLSLEQQKAMWTPRNTNPAGVSVTAKLNRVRLALDERGELPPIEHNHVPPLLDMSDEDKAVFEPLSLAFVSEIEEDVSRHLAPAIRSGTVARLQLESTKLDSGQQDYLRDMLDAAHDRPPDGPCQVHLRNVEHVRIQPEYMLRLFGGHPFFGNDEDMLKTAFDEDVKVDEKVTDADVPDDVEFKRPSFNIFGALPDDLELCVKCRAIIPGDGRCFTCQPDGDDKPEGEVKISDKGFSFIPKGAITSATASSSTGATTSFSGGGFTAFGSQAGATSWSATGGNAATEPGATAYSGVGFIFGATSGSAIGGNAATGPGVSFSEENRKSGEETANGAPNNIDLAAAKDGSTELDNAEENKADDVTEPATAPGGLSHSNSMNATAPAPSGGSALNNLSQNAGDPAPTAPGGSALNNLSQNTTAPARGDSTTAAAEETAVPDEEDVETGSVSEGAGEGPDGLTVEESALADWTPASMVDVTVRENVRSSVRPFVGTTGTILGRAGNAYWKVQLKGHEGTVNFTKAELKKN